LQLLILIIFVSYIFVGITNYFNNFYFYGFLKKINVFDIFCAGSDDDDNERKKFYAKVTQNTIKRISEEHGVEISELDIPRIQERVHEDLGKIEAKIRALEDFRRVLIEVGYDRDFVESTVTEYYHKEGLVPLPPIEYS
jgi:hypothetical protein